METVLIHIPLHPLHEESYLEHIFSMNLERTALFLRSRYKNIRHCRFYITFGDRNNNFLDLQSNFINLYKRFVEKNLFANVEHFNQPIYIMYPSHAYGFKDIIIISSYEDEFTYGKLPQHLERLYKRLTTSEKSKPYLGGPEVMECIYNIIRIATDGISIGKVTVSSKDNLFFYFLYPNLIKARSKLLLKGDLDDKEFYNFNLISKTSDPQLLNHPYRSQGSEKSMHTWPVFRKTNESISSIVTATIVDSLGRIPINDYGPNHTTHGYRTNIPSLFRDSSENTYNIALLGGSFVYGHNLPPSKTISGNLQRMVDKDETENTFSDSLKFQIHDLSCPQDTLFDSFIKLLNLTHLIKPNMIIAIGGLNDLSQMYKSPAEDHVPMGINASLFSKSISKRNSRNYGQKEIQLRLSSTFNAIEGYAKQIGAPLILHLQPWIEFKPFFKHNCPALFSSELAHGSAQLQKKYDNLIEYYSRSDDINISTKLTSITFDILQDYDPRALFIDKCHTTTFGAKLYSEVIYSDFISNLKSFKDLPD